MAFFLKRQPPATPAPLDGPPPPPRPSPLLAPLRAVGAAFAALDRAFAWCAVPFGVNIADPRRRFPLLLGLYAVIYLDAALAPPASALLGLAFGYVGVLAINRAWVRNEKERTLIVKKLAHGDPDRMPDLRWTALVAALQLLILFPLAFMRLHDEFGWFVVHPDATFGSWFWFAIDKTYLRALPDWSVLYGVHISSIDVSAAWSRHMVLLSRLTFDYILIQGVLRLLAIRATIGEAVAAVKSDPDMSVRLGRRAIAPLTAKLRDPDKGIRGAAANALTQLGAHDALRLLVEKGE
jgi:hypothetical protein